MSHPYIFHDDKWYPVHEIVTRLPREFAGFDVIGAWALYWHPWQGQIFLAAIDLHVEHYKIEWRVIHETGLSRL